ITNAQGYIAASTYLGTTGSDFDNNITVLNGETYMIGLSSNSGLPITTGNPFGGGSNDVTVTKFDIAGNILWCRYLGGNNSEFGWDIKVANGTVYLAGQTQSTNFPVTNGTTYFGANTGFYAKLNAATGAIQFSTYLQQFRAYDIEVIGGNVYLSGQDYAGTFEVCVQKYIDATNALVYTSVIGGSGGGTFYELPQYRGQNLKVIGNYIYLVGTTNNLSFPTTDGTAITMGEKGMVYLRLDAATGLISTASIFLVSPSGSTVYCNDFGVDNGKVYIYSNVFVGGLVTTDGSTYGGGGAADIFIVGLNAATGARQFARYIGGDGQNDEAIRMEVQNGIVYLLSATNSQVFPVTTGSGQANGGYDIAFMKLNANTGATVYATLIGGSTADNGNDMVVINGDAYIQGTSTGNGAYPVTNGSSNLSVVSDDLVFTKINSNNTICFSTYLGGTTDDTPQQIAVEGDNVFISGFTAGNAYPVTNGVRYNAVGDYVWTRFNLNPTLTPGPDNALPASQTVCKNGLAATITDTEIIFPSSSMPTIYRNGVASQQNAILVKYQWQKADAAAGPWVNIPGAVEINYTPQVGVINQYYRRLAYTSLCATSTPISTSTVAAVLVNANTAPTVNAGNIVNTCVGTAVTLGGTPTATGVGGATIVSYLWTPAGTYTPANTAANPVVTPASSTIYTVTATDNNGCQNIGQVLVNAYTANAGADVSTCANQTVRIGAAPIAGLAGVTYSWVASPADATMSCTTCAQPDVHPTVTTVYTLTLTIPVTGGGTCTTTDAVTVTPVAAPTAGFAGADKTLCLGSTSLLGTPAEAGFTYTWAPGNYLTVNNIAQPTFQPGNLVMPTPNPITYYVTAKKGGCTFVDEVVVTAIEARAGTDGCGPRTVGEPDRTPAINETYLWTKVSGDGNIIGANNTAQVNVSATTSGVTVYQLDVTYNGVTCTDQITIGTCGCVIPTITVNAPNTCASYSVNGGNVSLTASTSIPNSTFTWSPAAGLSSSTGATVFLTDNVARTYTVTATSPDGTTCINTKSVNNPAWSKPTFTAQDVTTCPATAVNIGQTTVAGYSYLWAGSGLSSTTISNPTATVSSTTNFPVTVTDIGSGCTATDTATVTIIGFPANLAGDDVTICGASLAVQLGTTASAGLTYLWTPASTYTPNNTAANPTVPVAATTTFTVVATNAATGCTATDDVTVTVNPPVAPFSFTDQTYCPSTAGAIALPAGPAGMSSYSWSPASQVLNPTSNGPTATTLNPRPAVATTYTLTVTNASGCTGAASVVFTPNVSMPVAGNSRTICLNSTAQLGATPALPGTYSWTMVASPVTATGSLSSTSISNPVFTPTSKGVFTFTVAKTDPGGCITTAKVIITVVDFTMGVIASPTVCQNSCVQIGVNSGLIQPGAQYSWTPSTGLSDANIANPIACVGTTSQSYTLTGVGVNGCVATQNVFVGVNAVPSPTITIPNLTACLGATGVSFNASVAPSGTYNYTWSPNDGTLSSIYVNNPTVNVATIGTKTYGLNVINATTGCASNATANLTVNYCALPIKLESFTAALQGTGVLLNWVVSEEINVANYEVEFSTDARSFWFAGAKAAINSKTYSFLHTSPVYGINYYRLKTIDKDGKVSYSEIRKVNVKVVGNISVYPNPAYNNVNVTVTANMVNKPALITIIAVDGRVILQKQTKAISQTEVFDVSNLAKGQYYLRITTESEVINKAFVVIR
ncbi:MAG: T9SS type A sorting domain-containing protein, partial [Ferruginibacter sp.]